MPDAPLDARAEITLLRDAIHASHEQGSHLHHVFSGWEECAPCEKANEEGDGTFACDAYKAWQKEAEAGHRSRAEVAVDQLVAALAETRTQLEIAERQNGELANVIAGTGLALWEEERDLARMRLAWQSARQRAIAYGEGILRQVSNREAWEGWAKEAQAEVVRLQSLLAERDEQIAGLLADEPTLDDYQPAAPR
ncbi:hypothetical protein [Streptomyces sp. NBC_00207]|uniref:hypothetical protein n=1 Tax=Streptomyces sp. NBC_00207 TaxID=2903635 RepID=UPI00324D9CE6